MPEHDSPTPHQPAPAPQPPYTTVSGKMMLLGSAIGCVVLFFIVWGSIRSVEHHVHNDRPDLDWSKRAQWIAPAVIKTTLVKPNASNAQYTYNKPRYRDPKFKITPEEEKAMLACAELASPDSNSDFTDDATRQALLQHTADQDYFYTHYLLATWHRLNGDAQTAKNLYQQSIADAPKIIVIRYTDAKGHPVSNLVLGTIEIGCDRVINEGQSLDQRLVLVYPAQKTDDAGRVYLPVYNTTYRPVFLPQPDGFEITYSHPEGWFKLPSRLGTLTATVRNEAIPPQPPTQPGNPPH